MEVRFIGIIIKVCNIPKQAKKLRLFNFFTFVEQSVGIVIGIRYLRGI